MITRYEMTLPPTGDHPLYPASAYRLYAGLLETLPPDQARWLHDGGGRGLSQCLEYEKATGGYRWIVNLLEEETAACLAPHLEALEAVTVEDMTLPILRRDRETQTMENLLTCQPLPGRICLTFVTPTAFRQAGRYAIFPQERLIVQSLAQRWTAVFPQCPLEDGDALEAMLTGLHIVDYNLRTTRFPLKGVRIPGFTGTCTLESRLPPPLHQLCAALLSFSRYSGIGIKTTIGMGAVL